MKFIGEKVYHRRYPLQTKERFLISAKKWEAAPILWHNQNMPYWFDGNNLIGQSAAAAKADSRARRAFLSALHSYQRSGGGRFLVYFDGDDSDRSAAPPGVSVRYSAPLSADEAILRRIREAVHPPEIIVVTNDIDLKTRCRHEGAGVLTWQEFTDRMSQRRLQNSRNHQPEKIDVDDWLRYFGLDDTTGK
jgi:predicted RNA-binding protein with PIN domain